MTFRDDAIVASEDIIDALGTPGCLYIPLEGNQATITAVVELGTFTIESDNGAYTSSQGRLEAKASDMPNVQEGDVFRHNTGTVSSPVYVDYTLFNPEDDGLGKVAAWLAKAS